MRPETWLQCIESLWKANNASEENKGWEGHPSLIWELKDTSKPLKIHWISVAKRPKQGQCKCPNAWLKTWGNEACKEEDDSKQKRVLKKTCLEGQNKTFSSLCRSPKIHANKAKIWCKISLKRENGAYKEVDDLKQIGVLKKSSRWAQNETLFSSCQRSKIVSNGAKV